MKGVTCSRSNERRTGNLFPCVDLAGDGRLRAGVCTWQLIDRFGMLLRANESSVEIRKPFVVRMQRSLCHDGGHGTCRGGAGRVGGGWAHAGGVHLRLGGSSDQGRRDVGPLVTHLDWQAGGVCR